MHPNQLIHIAVADDHTLFLEGLSSTLDSFEGLKVTVRAKNGQELLQKIESSEILPDICLLDVQMPVMNGYDAALAMKKQWPSIKVIAVSMYDDEMNILKMLHRGAKGYLTKDADFNELRKAIKTVYEKDFYLSEIVSESVLHKLSDKSNHSIFELTDRDMKFLTLSCMEYSQKEIAALMDLGKRTIQDISAELCEKFGVKTRVGLAICAIQMGLINPGDTIH